MKAMIQNQSLINTVESRYDVVIILESFCQSHICQIILVCFCLKHSDVHAVSSHATRNTSMNEVCDKLKKTKKKKKKIKIKFEYG